MGKYVKASDQLVEVVDGDGKKQKVTQRAFDIVYAGRGYTLASAASEPSTDYSTFSRSKLEGVKNEELEAYLESKGIKYEEGSVKKVLINLILGE